MKKHMTKLAVVLLLATSGAVHAMPILDIQGGQLFGASGVNVGGTLYDVEFVDGTCFGLFSGCDEITDFTFQTSTDVELATQALLDQVFLDGVFGSFDSAPMLTNGCEDTFRCIALTPFGVFGPWVDLGIAFNNDVGTDTIGFGGWGTANNSLTSGQVTFARWTVGPAVAMPEPTSLAVFALGLFVLGLSRRRHQR